MNSILLSVILIGSFLFYHSSEKVQFSCRPTWLNKWSKYKKTLRSISILLFILSGFVLAQTQGIGAGIFALTIYIMAAFSVTILLVPYGLLRWYQLAAIFVLCLSLELLVF
ncbi:hypothetical protein [Sphingobacterium yanglingense]|uniref:Uncharacterized protein n=1 Tax=Sphingobacterium yanglingense TaxID=1437280 RepID=A0A4R6WP65_9SPHI|nr:hypothetical protein [Sphingobacterium yanglingense]TDQ80195.1 hypothetical protein CLV99_1652 [Sphingobacterium yanglingense]